jgi:hypothetical protein
MAQSTDPKTYLDKAPTALQRRFADYIVSEVGYNPATAKSKQEAFEEGVRIATATRMVFQASTFNREGRAEEIANRPAKAPKTPKLAKTAAPAKAAKAAKAAPAAEAKPAKATRRRAAAPVEDAPF